MLFPGDLAFRVVAVLIFVVFPAGFFVFRRKGRIAAARRAEINRLLVLASEEAARAEIEASVGYSVTYDVPLARHCAVCYNPTHNRCARCKSVHYCSGKCQIIHWRQGHKDECHPPPPSFENNEETISLVENCVKQPYPDNTARIEIDTAPEKARFPSEFSVKDDNNTVDDSACVNESGSLSEIDESSSGDDICVDNSADKNSLHDLNSDSCESCSIFDRLESSLGDKNVAQSNTAREESYTKVKSGSNTDPTDATADRGNDSLELRISSDNNSTEPMLSTSDFWDGYLDSSGTKKYVYNSNAEAKFGTSDDREFYSSKSSLQYFSLSGNLSSEYQSRGPKESSGTSAGISGAYKLAEPTLQGKESTVITGQRSSTSSSPQKPDVSINNIRSDGASRKSGKVRPAGEASKDSGLLSCDLNVAKNLDRDKKDALSSPLSKKDGFSQKFPSGLSSSGTKGSAAPVAKSTKANCNDTLAPQVTASTATATVGLKTSVVKVVEQLRAPRSSKQREASGRSSDTGVFPYELFVKLYHWNKVELRPCGLINCGNSCYANVVLQCLVSTPPLTAYFLQGLHSKACVKKEGCFTCEFEKLILKAKEGSSVLSPMGILSQIQKIGSHLATGREEDAHEFLRYAIDTMQSICLREAGVNVSSPLEEETTLMGLTFGGYLRSKIRCTRCHGKSERQERMMDLTVEIEGDIETLEDALRKFTGTECLDGDNKYYCGRCKSYEKAKKKLSILEAPNVLTIALKRFQSGKFGKLNKSIRFPEVLNLTPYMRGSSDKSPIYRLYGAVVHLDIMNAAFSGHYVCYVRNAHKWYKIDDIMVKGVELDRVLNKGAYMLFYSRCSPRAPRSVRSSVVSQDLSSEMKNPEVGPSRNTAPRHNLSHDHQGETRLPPNILEFDSASDTSSLFSNSDEVSSSTDSNRDSISADDISDYIFGHNGFWRHSSDSNTSSSSSSSSSSPLYTNSALSNSERYVSSRSEPIVSQSSRAHSIPVRDPSGTCAPRETCRAEQPGASVGVPFLQPNSSKQVRNVVNSSCRGADSGRLGWTNSLTNVNSGVHLRRTLRKKADEAFHHTVLS